MKRFFTCWFFLPLLGLCLAACSDDNGTEVPADADDNFITSFCLTLGGEEYAATIDGNDITVTVPYTVSLQGAVATVAYTSSATILPDPATVDEWDDEQIFRVTSYNGEVNEYTYRAVKEEISSEGDVELKTAADIAAFAEAGTSVVKGNLTIGTDDGEEIESVEALTKIKQITGNLILKNSFKATDLTGLEHVETLGGLVVGSVGTASEAELNLVTMNALAEITGDVVIRNNSLKWIELGALQKIGGDVVVASTALESVELPALTEIGGDLDLCGITQIAYDEYGNVNMGGAVAELSFPQLAKVGGVVRINYFAALTGISLPELSAAGGVEIPTLGHLFETIDLSALTVVDESLKIGSVRTAGKFASDAANNTTLRTLGDLSKLQSVGDSLKIENFSGMTELPAFSALKSVRVLYIAYAESVENDLDLSSVVFPEDGALIINNNCSIPTVVGNGAMAGDMMLETSNLAGPSVKGFTSVRNLTVTVNNGAQYDKSATIAYDFERIEGNVEINYRVPMNAKGQNTIAFPNLTQVGGAFVMPQQATMRFKKLSCPKLQTIGGQFCITSPAEEYDFPELTTVGCADNAELLKVERTSQKVPTYGMMDITLYSVASVFEMPKLARVGGLNGLYLDCSNTKATTISCPALTEVDEKIWIFGSTSSLKNAKITSIAMPKLEKAKAVSIERFSKFSDFSSFVTVVQNGSVTAENWTVTDCTAYAPTYEQMKAGQARPE